MPERRSGHAQVPGDYMSPENVARRSRRAQNIIFFSGVAVFVGILTPVVVSTFSSNTPAEVTGQVIGMKDQPASTTKEEVMTQVGEAGTIPIYGDVPQTVTRPEQWKLTLRSVSMVNGKKIDTVRKVNVSQQTYKDTRLGEEVSVVPLQSDSDQ